MICVAEERSAHYATTVTEAQAEERHSRCRSEAERAQQDENRKLRLSLEAALKAKGAMPELPCPGCIARNSTIAKLEEKNDVLEQMLREQAAGYHKLEAECAEQTLRLSYDLDKARQTVATAYSVKAATDTENARLFNTVNPSWKKESP